MGILPRVARIEGGEVLFRDPRQPDTVTDIARLDPVGVPIQSIRGSRISIIFQEPMTALAAAHHRQPDRRGLALHRSGMGRQDADAAVVEMLRLVGFFRPGESRAQLSLRAVRRVAAARHDRDGAGLPTVPC